MTECNSIKERYRQADANERLNLYLDCRDFRREFTTIEQEEASSKIAGVPETSVMRKIVGNFFSRYRAPGVKTRAFQAK